MTINYDSNSHLKKRKKRSCLLQVSAISYQNYVDFAHNETRRRTVLLPSPLQERFNLMIALDGQTKIEMLSFEAPRIRLLRIMSIEGEAMQVLDFSAFPKPEFHLPIFCGNFFTAANTNIVVLDLNPLHDVISRRDYRKKYYDSLMTLGLKYTQLLPWGGKLTSESMKFFSPVVIWTKFTSSKSKDEALCSALMEYDKDPGHQVLKKLVGEKLAKDLLRNFLFGGVDELGRKTFLDYFPEYRTEDGSINEKRSMVGKSFENRPWGAKGEFVGNDLTN